MARGRVSWFELEIPEGTTTPVAQTWALAVEALSQARLLVGDPWETASANSRRGRVSWFELELPASPLTGVTATFQVPLESLGGPADSDSLPFETRAVQSVLEVGIIRERHAQSWPYYFNSEEVADRVFGVDVTSAGGTVVQSWLMPWTALTAFSATRQEPLEVLGVTPSPRALPYETEGEISFINWVDIPVVLITRAGGGVPLPQVTSDPVRDHVIRSNDGHVFVEIENVGGSTNTATFVTSALVIGLEVDDLVVSVPATSTRIVGPFPEFLFNQVGTRDMLINVESTDLRFRAFQLIPG